MLVSAFVAAAALAQAFGNATNCARTAVLFVEPTTATLAVVDSYDGSVADVRRQPLPKGRDAVVAELAAMAPVLNRKLVRRVCSWSAPASISRGSSWRWRRQLRCR